jgi:hypothetical protein
VKPKTVRVEFGMFRNGLEAVEEVELRLQFNTPGPYIVITVTILLLHVVSANLLVPKFIATRVSIGPVAATVGILFWGWLWGVMGLLLAVPLTAFVKLVADLHPSLCHVSNMLALTPRPTPRWVLYGETALERAIPYFARPSGKAPVGRPPLWSIGSRRCGVRSPCVSTACA